MKQSDSDEAKIRLLLIILYALIILFLEGHISAVINSGASFSSVLNQLLLHIKEHPLDVIHFNLIVYVYGFGIWIICVIGTLCRRALPKAQMKGIEKGSNEFMDESEIKEFLKNNTTPVIR